MRLSSGPAAVLALLALPAALAGPGSSSQRLGSPAAVIATEGEQGVDGRDLLDGSPIGSVTDFPGVVVLHNIFHFFGVAVGSDRIVALLELIDNIDADTEVFPLEKNEPERTDKPFTFTVGTTSISGGMTVVFTKPILSSIGVATIGAAPTVGEELTIVGFEPGRSATLNSPTVQATATVVACGANAGENKFCIQVQGSSSFLPPTSSGETAAIFRNNQVVGLLDPNFARFDIDDEDTVVARSLESLVAEIESAQPTDNLSTFDPNGVLKMAGLAFGGLAVVYVCCLVCVCAVASKRNAQQLAELQQGNLNSPEAIAARAAAAGNGLPQLQPASQRQQMFVMQPGAPPPAGMVAVAYIMPDEPVVATAVPVSDYKY